MKFSLRLLKWSALVYLPFLAACASGPTQEQFSNANYGRDLSPIECVAVAEKVIANSLKDPGSAQFRHSQCFKGHWSSVPLLGMGVEFGWIQQGEVNGKNSYGGYVGFKPYQVLIKNGTAVRYCINDKDGICVPSGR